MLAPSSKMGCLLDALDCGYRVLGLDEAAGGDEVFRQLVLARIIEPARKIDSLRVLEEAGESPPSYATLKRRLPGYAKTESMHTACSRVYRCPRSGSGSSDVAAILLE